MSVASLRVATRVDCVVALGAERGSSRMDSLYEASKRGQWNASSDIDWSHVATYGAPLPPDSCAGQQAFRASPLFAAGPGAWDRFRWEHHAWLVSQFLYGEQGALVAAARLVEVVEDPGAKRFAAIQVADEARHVEAFSRYVRTALPAPYPPSPGLSSLLADVLAAREWDLTALGMQIVIEPLALGAFRAADSTLHDPLARRIVALVAGDEARHVAFGVGLLRGALAELGSQELERRREFVLEAVGLMVHRSLLEEIWARLEVPAALGTSFAATEPLMRAYRNTVFSRVLACVESIGLLDDTMIGALSRLGLSGPWSRGPHQRHARRSRGPSSPRV